jgi:hypothetical protein
LPMPSRQRRRPCLQHQQREKRAQAEAGRDRQHPNAHLIHQQTEEQRRRDHAEHRPANPDLAAAGRALLAQLPFSHDDRDGSYRLQLVAKADLTGAGGSDTARLVWRNFVAAVARQETYAFEQQSLLKALFSTQAAALLDEIAAGEDNTTREMFRLLRNAGHVDGNPVDAIPAETVLAWCRAAPTTRFLRAAAINHACYRRCRRCGRAMDTRGPSAP